MKYNVEVCQLSIKFYTDYPSTKYPEIMYKKERPYTCVLIDVKDYYICIPFRSSIQHNDAFLFTNTIRSLENRSGLDYKKVILIKDTNYLNTTTPAIVDSDEYKMMMSNIKIIINEICDYITTYVNHIKGIKSLHRREFLRHYLYSTLPYFHNILGLSKANKKDG